MVRSIFSFLARSARLFSRSLVSERTTTKLPIFLSAWEAVALSICLTKLVKGSLISRAKIMTTGFLPFFQTRQDFLPAPGPVACNGSKGVTAEPGCGPDTNGAAAQAPAARPGRRLRRLG